MSQAYSQSLTHRNPAHASSAADEPTRNRTSEESGMQKDQHNTQSPTALLREESRVDTLETNSLCCAAAGIIASTSSTTEAPIPHEKLREAATPNATLTAQNRPPAQPVVGYGHASPTYDIPRLELFDSLVQAVTRHVAARPFTGPRALMHRFGIGLQHARWILVVLEQRGLVRGHCGRLVATSYIQGVSAHRIYRVNPEAWGTHLTMDKQGQMGVAR